MYIQSAQIENIPVITSWSQAVLLIVGFGLALKLMWPFFTKAGREKHAANGGLAYKENMQMHADTRARMDIAERAITANMNAIKLESNISLDKATIALQVAVSEQTKAIVKELEKIDKSLLHLWNRRRKP
jgi:hypothetical protein